MDSVDNISRTVDGILKNIYDNRVASSVLGLFLVLYAGLAAPKLPRSVSKHFGNKMVKTAVLFLVAYLSSKNVALALLIAVSFMVSVQTFAKQEADDSFVQN